MTQLSWLRLGAGFVALQALLCGCGSPAGEGSGGDALHVVTSGVLQIDPRSPAELRLEAAGGKPPYQWSLSSASPLPAGLALSSDGIISGVPLASGRFPLTVTVRDAAGASASASLALLIGSAAGSTACETATPLALSGTGATTVEGKLFQGSPGLAAQACAVPGAEADAFYSFDLPTWAKVSVAVRSDAGAVAALFAPSCPATPAPAGCQQAFSTTLAPGTHTLAVTGPKDAEYAVDLSVQPLTGETCDDPIPIDPTAGVVVLEGQFGWATDGFSGSCTGGSARVYTFTLSAPGYFHAMDVGEATGKFLRSATSTCLGGTEVACTAPSQSEFEVVNLPAGTYFLFLVQERLPYQSADFRTLVQVTQAVALPANDICAGALPIDLSSGQATISGSWRFATLGTGAAGQCGVNRVDLYYSIDLAQPADLRITSASGAVVAQMLSGDCASLAEERCFIPQPSCSSRLPAGRHYLRAFRPQGAENTEDFQLTLSREDIPAPPSNESCSTAEVLTLSGGKATLQARLDLAQRNETVSCASPTAGGDLVYRIDLPARSDVALTWNGDYSARYGVAVETGTCGATPAPCDQNQKSQTLLGVPAGPMWIVVQGESLYSSATCWRGDFSMEVAVHDSPPIPANDTCPGAEVVDLPALGSSAVVHGTTAGANTDLAPASCGAGSLTGPDVFYRIQLGVPGRLWMKDVAPFGRMAYFLTTDCSVPAKLRCGWENAGFLTDPLPAGSYVLGVECSAGMWMPTAGDFAFTVELF